MKKFVTGRENIFQKIEATDLKKEKIIWFHAASLGEYEQGLPIMEELKKRYPAYKLLVTFFSPSGYEVKKDNSIADYVFYLPLDTTKNAAKFIQAIQPEFVVFIKYEIWPNYLKEISKAKIPVILISGVFRENQIYFKSYGRFLYKALNHFNHIFVQNKTSAQVLEKNKSSNVSISGDTRFDRVHLQLKKNNKLDFIEDFLQNKTNIVFGSTWPEGEAYITKYINSSNYDIKYIIAPHQIKDEKIDVLKKCIKKKTILFSEIKNQDLSSFQVLIVDTVGLLSKIYSYASIAYVGGAIGKTGLHNILEPAVFGLPIIIGTHYKKFPEAEELIKKGGVISISDYNKFCKTLNELTTNKKTRIETGQKSQQFILDNLGATKKVINYIESKNYLKK